jgi:proline iminopeptidase
MDPRRRAVTVSGVPLAYTSEGSGPPLLVVGSSIYYPKTFSPHLRQHFRVVCADLPHFVQPPADFDVRQISFDYYAHCIEAVRKAAGLVKVTVVGHSHHGNVALEYARRFPDHVSHVVMIGSPPASLAQTVKEAELYWTFFASDERKRLLTKRRGWLEESRSIAQSPKEAYISQYVADAPLYWYDPEYDARWLWDGMEFNMEVIHRFRDLYRDYELNWEDELAAIPVLAIHGEQDYAVPHTLWMKIPSIPPGFELRLLTLSGHTPQLEQPQEFDRVLLDSLGDTAQG